ncbi:MAG: RIP metalloprotease RseP [Pyrinomonadaceae bacterium]
MFDILIVILAVIFVLGIAINIHEFGHFAVAKLFGMRVEAYSFFGLGPRIWGKKIGHTDYRISAIPLGAYVKLYGDEATGALEGGESKGEIVPDSELYELRPRWQKFLVMVGGPFMNIMLALAIPFAGGLIYGVPSMPSPIADNIKPGGAAEQAGIKVGDRIVTFNGVENPSWERIRNDSMIAPEMEIPVVVERGGQRTNLTIKPTKEDLKGNTIGALDFAPTEPVIVIPSSDSPAEKAGIQKGDKAISINGETVSSVSNFQDLIQKYKQNPINLVVVRNNEPKEIALQAKIGEDGKAVIGASLSNKSLDREKASISQAAAFAVNTNLEIIRLTGRVFGQLFAGQRSVKDAGVAGPIGIVQIISQVVHEQGFVGLISILGLISLNLGVFNLLPIPMLDGGQIAVLAIEGFLALFGLTLSMAIKEKIQLAGLAIILLLMVTVIFFDVSRLIGK